MEIVTWLLANWSVILGAVLGLMLGVLGVLKVIPGIQPGEKMLENAAATLQKLIKK